MSTASAPLLLALETATDVCSVALFRGEELLAVHETRAPRLHNRLLSVLVEQLLQNLDLKAADLQGVGLSSGPGSYTGLRVGASYAQGLCYALGVPLVAVPTLEALAAAALPCMPRPDARLLPLLDARRMEVYAACYAADLSLVAPAQARIADADLPDELAGKGVPVVCVGDGAAKCRHLWAERPDLWVFEGIGSGAAAMGRPLARRFAAGDYADALGFEPLYLKPVQTRAGRDPLAGR